MRAGRGLRLFAGAGLAVALGAIVAAFLWLRVCDEQLASTGAVVSVCRHMTATDPPVLVLGVVALALLSVFYAEISGFGFTLRRKVAELDERSDALQETVGDLAEFNRERLVPQVIESELDTAGSVPDPRIAALAERYNTLRWTMPSSSKRTSRMTALFEQLQDVLRAADDFDLAGHLTHHDRGMRLAAYGYLRTHTVPELMTALVNAAATEDTPFGQYAALRAAIHQRDTGAPLSGDDRRTLRALRHRAGPETDRAQLVNALLDENP